ncbi:flagellar biosynthesis protein FlgD [Altererythrobacter sp. B11]|uniref:flagellar hook assembly protein FlgD n=1 Tax=Altererythrobacter sp. B11 TaxID=2060312 RepID=UPI000DC712A5|nr:flagellar hook capping FlgD N-terminal domain-containing protein [Altererythrobacter sp. B11]BBC72171.1 flagellar biosynthesis protein FlgD [Altererythrobacter sp. B11]
MTTVNSATAPGTSPGSSSTGFSSLGSDDFLKLLVVQMQQQDPFDPVDNKEMLAQMAQFSSLSAATDSSTLLKDISDKLDLLVAANASANGSADQPANSDA